ncbi:MAG: PIG-L family deacetylase [Patescibacteria group bacterium]|nr:PIG-L family deacetylase [Patescibacteria group bacterium]
MKDILKLEFNSSDLFLFVMPHPDDEAVFCAGFIKRLTRSGNRVKVITLTKGEKSTHRYGLEEKVDLGEARSVELANALGILGINDSKLFDIPDGEIEKHYSRTREIVEEEIYNFQPDYVVTLEPSGIYGHPDHIALSEIVKDIGDKLPNQFRLIYATVGSRFHPSKGASAMAEKKVVPLEASHFISLRPKEVYTKVRALFAHKSQFGKGLIFKIVKWYLKGLSTREYYYKVE